MTFLLFTMDDMFSRIYFHKTSFSRFHGCQKIAKFKTHMKEF